MSNECDTILIYKLPLFKKMKKCIFYTGTWWTRFISLSCLQKPYIINEIINLAHKVAWFLFFSNKTKVLKFGCEYNKI